MVPLLLAAACALAGAARPALALEASQVYRGRVASPRATVGEFTGSADGYHVAFLARDGDRELWYVDDKRVGSYPKGATPQLYHRLALNRDGTKLAVTLYVFDPQGHPLGEAVFLNGEQGPLFDEIKSVGFSEDGRRLGYLGRRSAQWAAVVDQKPGPFFGSEPKGFKFHRDNGHFAYVGEYQDGHHLLLDHDPVQKWPDASLYLSGGWRVRGHNDGYDAIKLNDERRGPFGSIDNVVLDNDGRHFLVRAFDAQAKGYRMFLDGQPSGPVLASSIHDMLFGPDGAAYWVDELKTVSDGRLYRNGVLVGSSRGSFSGTPAVALSPSGRHYAFIAEDAEGHGLFVDGRRVLQVEQAPWVGLPIAFDSERELHWLSHPGGAFDVHCVLLDGSSDESRSVCARAVRQRNPHVE